MRHLTSQADINKNRDIKWNKVGKTGISKGNSMVRMQNLRDSIEDAFMYSAFKSRRADEQRDSRRAKR